MRNPGKHVTGKKTEKFILPLELPSCMRSVRLILSGDIRYDSSQYWVSYCPLYVPSTFRRTVAAVFVFFIISNIQILNWTYSSNSSLSASKSFLPPQYTEKIHSAESV